MKITRKQLRKIIEASVVLSDKDKEAIEDSKERAMDTIARQSDGVNKEDVKDAYEKSKEEDDSVFAESVEKQGKYEYKVGDDGCWMTRSAGTGDFTSLSGRKEALAELDRRYPGARTLAQIERCNRGKPVNDAGEEVENAIEDLLPLSESKTRKEIKISEIDQAFIVCLKKEGGSRS